MITVPNFSTQSQISTHIWLATFKDDQGWRAITVWSTVRLLHHRKRRKFQRRRSGNNKVWPGKIKWSWAFPLSFCHLLSYKYLQSSHSCCHTYQICYKMCTDQIHVRSNQQENYKQYSGGMHEPASRSPGSRWLALFSLSKSCCVALHPLNVAEYKTTSVPTPCWWCWQFPFQSFMYRSC
jgi:hypothetical protein